MSGPAEQIPNSASHEIDRWPWQYREYYGTLAVVVLAHVLVIVLALRLLIPELRNHQVAGELREIKTSPAVAWVDNGEPAPSTPSAPSPADNAPRLPFATGLAPEDDPPSEIALPLPPATPEPAHLREETAPPEPQPDPEPAPQPKLIPAVKPAPAPPPEGKKRSLPVLNLAPAPAPAKPAPVVEAAPRPVPVTPPTPKPEPKPEPARVLKPAPQPGPKPAPVVQPVVLAAPAPPAQPVLRPVIAVRPEIVAPAPVAGPATTAAPTGPASSSGTFGAASGPGGRDQSDDLSNYHRLIHDTFHRNWRQPTSLPSGHSTYQTKVSIVIARDGTIVGTSFVRASGNPVMDESVHQAISTVRSIAPLPSYIESANYSVVINFQLD